MLLYTISYLNWKYIELPFQKNFIRSKKMALSILFVVMCGSTLTLLNEDSFINRYTNIPNKALLLAFKIKIQLAKMELIVIIEVLKTLVFLKHQILIRMCTLLEILLLEL